jgi:subtilisin family serine protease
VNPASDELLNTVSGRARIPRDEVIVCRHKLRLSTETRNLGDLADIDGIRAILPVEKPQLHNNVARNILNANVDINGTSYQGDGQTVCVADTGFDVGSTDPAVMHPAFIGRVAHLYDLGGRGKSSDPEGHGTHVAGSVLGNGSSKTMGGAIQGTAPQATLVVQSAYQTSFKDLGGLPADLNDLFQPPYDDYQVRIHTNSWGFGVGVMGRQRPYNFSSAAFELDEFVWEHKDMVICFAAGNDGTDVVGPDGISDVRQVGAVAAAKNCITVGASESIRLEHRPRFATYGDLRPASYPRDPLHSDQMSNNAEGMAAFSSRGKTAENRVKPDVVAPGTSILSARSRAAGSAPNDFGTSSDPDWWFDSGTSMATPLVAGCAAVVRETLVKNGRPQPSAALIKALLINGAVDLIGQYNPTEAKRAPNDDAGWGRVNLAASIIIPGPGSPAGGDDIPPLNKGDPPVVITVPIPEGPPNDASTEDASGIRTFKVTLVWTDPPELNGKLQNNLDLVVIASNGLERFGNMGTAKGSDSINNVEQVVWENIPAGDAQIVVRPTAIRVDSQPAAYAWRLS